MSKVPYTIDLDRFICSELEEIRRMCKNLDFSMLPATIERLQHHGQAMEDALYAQKDYKYDVNNVIDEIVNGIKDKKVDMKGISKKLKKLKKKINK